MGRVPADELCACMSSSPLDRILERESILLNRVNEAASQAERMVGEAQDSVMQIAEEGEGEARRLAEIEMGRIAQETTTQIIEIEAQRERERVELRGALEANMPATVEFIVATVVGDASSSPDRGGSNDAC